MYGSRYFAPRYFGPRYFGAGESAVADGSYFGARYFGPRMYGPRYWSPEASAALVEVPDVVSQSQASGTTELETALFVVAVANAYSSTVPAGLIISQSPTGGSFASEGSTVTITVSLGAAPVSDETPSGGWLFLNSYQAELNRRKRRKKELEELEEEVEKIEVKLDRDIAKLLHEQDEKDERQKDMARLHALAKAEQDLKAAQELGDRVANAYARALRQGNYSALEALDRELRRAIEEEEFLLEAARMFY